MDSNDVSVDDAEKIAEDMNEQNSEEEWSGAEEEEEDGEIDPEEWKLVDEEYITVDLIGLIKNNALKDCEKNEIKLIGLFDEHPMLQIGKTLFIGDREEVSGTNALFQVEKRSASEESDDDEELAATTEKAPENKVELKCTTRKKLVMRQCSLSEKKTNF